MNDISQYFFFDHCGTQRLRRGPQPSSAARLEQWAHALRNAYFERRHMNRRDERIGDYDADGEPIVWSDVNFQGLLAKIVQMAEREKAHGGQEARVFEATKNAFIKSSANQRACLRICILDAAMDGVMTPDDADKWARRLGLPQIGKCHVSNHCDPMQESQWSLLMAAVWIQWRDLRYVARLSLDSVEFIPQWVKIEHEDGSTGYELDPYGDLEEAKPDLMRFLRSGASNVTGFRDGERREISAADWADLRIVGRYSDDGFASVVMPNGECGAYERVRLSRDALIATAGDDRVPDKPPAIGEPNEKKPRRTKSVRLSEVMKTKFGEDPGKSVEEWRRYFRLNDMHEYESADEDTILKARDSAWPPK